MKQIKSELIDVSQKDNDALLPVNIYVLNTHCIKLYLPHW